MRLSQSILTVALEIIKNTTDLVRHEDLYCRWDSTWVSWILHILQNLILIAPNNHTRLNLNLFF